MVAGVAADVDADDRQSKRFRGDDANNGENGRCKKEPNRDGVRDCDCECSSGRHRSERERN